MDEECTRENEWLWEKWSVWLLLLLLLLVLYVALCVWEEEEEVGPGWVVPFSTGPWAVQQGRRGGLAGSANFSR